VVNNRGTNGNPKMNIIFQCDNANHVEISRKICENIYPSDLSIEVISLDWQNETFSWVTEQVARSSWSVRVTNIFATAPQRARKAFFSEGKAGARNKILQEICFAGLKRFIGRDDVLVIQFNDVSVRGSAIASTCRRIGIRRFLIQDGFLSFRSKTNRLSETDQNYRWASTRPDIVAVWGKVMKDQIIERFNLRPDSVHVVGPTKSIIIPKRIVRDAPEGPFRVMWADQAVLDQRKAESSKWLAEFSAIAAELSQFQTTVRLHPSTTKRNREALLACMPTSIVVDADSNPLTPEKLEGFHCVVTYYSTVFLDCISAGVPCVVLRTSSLDIELPEIDHPLLTYVAPGERISDVVRAAASAAINAVRGDAISSHIADLNGYAECAAVIQSEISRCSAGAVAPTTNFADDYEARVALRRIEGKRLLVLGTMFGRNVGVGKPIVSYYKEMMKYNLDIDFFLVTGNTSEDLMLAAESASVVIINSLDVIRVVPEWYLKELINRCIARDVPVLFYAHETEYVFERRRKEHPTRFKAFLEDIVPRIRFLAVSDLQAEWLYSIGACDVHVVYNSIGFMPQCTKTPSENDDPLILMVGTRQSRKGVELFSNVADLAKASGRAWRFKWIGEIMSESAGLYHSPNVEWVGHLPEDLIRRELSKSSVFFLSSIDDPMPLSVGEALAAGVPCLVYKCTGYSDFIKFFNVGETFDFYDPEHAFQRLVLMLDRIGSYNVDAEQVARLVGAQAFSRRLTIALGASTLMRPRGWSRSELAARDRRLRPATFRRLIKSVARFVRPLLPRKMVRPMWLVAKRWKLID